MCVTFVTCEVRVCGLRCRSGSSLDIYRVDYLLLVYVQRRPAPATSTHGICITTSKYLVVTGRRYTYTVCTGLAGDCRTND